MLSGSADVPYKQGFACSYPGRNGAAAKCSNQADLRLALSDPIRDPDLPQRPSSAGMLLVRIEEVMGRDRGKVQGLPHPAAWPLWFASAGCQARLWPQGNRSREKCLMNVHAKTSLTPVSGSRVSRRSGMGEVWRGRPPTPTPRRRCQAGSSAHRAHPAPPPRPPRHLIHAVELSNCQDQTDQQCSRKVQQPGRLTSDLHRPDLTV
jgi:hypothetical protein